MNILFAVYDNFPHDQRATETILALSYIGKVTTVSLGSIENDNVSCIITGNGKRNYILFKRKLIQTYKKLRPDVVFLHDQATSFFIGWLIHKKQNVKILYDSSELYYDKFDLTLGGIKGVILQLTEKKYLHYANHVFAANIERAQIMKDVYGLENLPTVWDNIHRIDDEYDKEACEEKFGKYFSSQNKVILYCGGINKRRGTYDLIKAVESLGKDYILLVAGFAAADNLNYFNKLYAKSKTRNFYYLGFLSRSELKYLLNKSLISVSIFDFSCVNHIFCASGKVYEALFEGVPVLTSTNPPLSRLCRETGVGIATDNYGQGILKILENYDKYKNNIISYVNGIDYDQRMEKLIELLKQAIGSI